MRSIARDIMNPHDHFDLDVHSPRVYMNKARDEAGLGGLSTL